MGFTLIRTNGQGLDMEMVNNILDVMKRYGVEGPKHLESVLVEYNKMKTSIEMEK